MRVLEKIHLENFKCSERKRNSGLANEFLESSTRLMMGLTMGSVMLR